MLSLSKTALVKVVKNAFIFLIITSGNLSIAALQPIQDEELSAYVGQAAIHINQDQDTSQNLNYTKIQFGLDIKTNATIGAANLGTYVRDGVNGSDISLENSGLGYIDEKGNMVPMEIKDPYLELARDTNTNEVKGIRIGFGSIQGLMTGALGNLTGDVKVRIRDNSENLIGGVFNATSVGNPPPLPDWNNPISVGWYYAQAGAYLLSFVGGNIANIPNYPSTIGKSYDTAIATLTSGILYGTNGFWGGNPYDVEANATLVNFNTGERQNIRSTYLGLPNGSPVTIKNLNALSATAVTGLVYTAGLALLVPFGVNCSGAYPCQDVNMVAGGQLISTPCHILTSTEVCFGTNTFKSFYFGDKEQDTPAEGVYLSLQKDGLTWSGAEEKQQTLASGFNFVAPDGAITVNFIEATGGTNPGRTKYVSDPFAGHEYYR